MAKPKTQPAPAQDLVARLRPYNPELGQLRRGIFITKLGLSFDEGVVVTGITPSDARALREVRQRDDDPKSPLAFDVCSPSEMEAIIAAEARERLGLTPEMVRAMRELPAGADAGGPVWRAAR